MLSVFFVSFVSFVVPLTPSSFMFFVSFVDPLTLSPSDQATRASSHPRRLSTIVPHEPGQLTSAQSLDFCYTISAQG